MCASKFVFNFYVYPHESKYILSSTRSLTFHNACCRQILEFYGNNFEKETFEKKRLDKPVNHGSQFLDVIGNIARYRDGQYSFTKSMARSSANKNLYLIIYFNKKTNKKRKKNVFKCKYFKQKISINTIQI